MKTVGELKTWTLAPKGAGFSVGDVRAGEAVVSALRRLASRSLWLQEERELGPAVVNQEVYDLAVDVLDVAQIMVGTDPAYKRVSLGALWDLKASRTYLPPRITGAFAPRFTANAERQISVWPAPDAIVSITGLVAVLPADLDDADTPPFPDDAEDALKAYIKADLYEDIDEDPNSAQVQRAEGDAFAGELFRRNRSQVGSGPVQMQVARVHF